MVEAINRERLFHILTTFPAEQTTKIVSDFTRETQHICHPTLDQICAVHQDRISDNVRWSSPILTTVAVLSKAFSGTSVNVRHLDVIPVILKLI